MPQLQISTSVSGLGQTINNVKTYEADGGTPREIVVPVGKAGTLTTRTDANTGTATLAADHGIQTGDKVDIFWNIGGVPGCQYKVTVGTVAGTSVPFDLGVGDNLPVQGSAIVMSKRVEFSADVDGDALKAISFKMHFDQVNETAVSHVDFQDASNAEVQELDLSANGQRILDITGGDSNIFTGNPITKGFVSNASVTNAAKFQLLALFDSTP